MTWVSRSCALTAGAAALISAQTVYAAPVTKAPGVDPLVSLSVLGTAQSRAAVAPAMAGTAIQGAPIMAGPPPGLPANQYPQPNQYYTGAWVLFPGLLGLLAILALHLTDDDDRDLAPVSP